MAHNAKISGLTDELIYSILDFDPASNRQAYKHAKELTSRAIRSHQYARTNQFEVASTFAGLDEKFRVKNRSDLADALQIRLKRLQAVPSKFQPEQLSFLLHLSDRPLENTRIEALELIRPPEPPPVLTWAEILEADPYSDEEIWQDIDYATDTSQTDKEPKKKDKPAVRDTPFQEEDIFDLDGCTLTTELDDLDVSRSAQFWRDKEDQDSRSSTAISELQAVRETLFMLSGQPTNLFQLDVEKSRSGLDSTYQLGDGTSKSMMDLLTSFMVIGNGLLYLRRWMEHTCSVPLLQRFQASVRSCLVTYEASLAQQQARYLRPASPATVSLLELYNDIRDLSLPLLRLAEVIRKVEPKVALEPFAHMEALFDETVLAQMTLDMTMFHFWSKMFFDCFQIYIKPIRNWMEAGQLSLNNDTFFVYESDANSDITSLWHDRYLLRQDMHDRLQAPSFIHPAAKKIFNTGKSIVFLRELGLTSSISISSQHEPSLNHDTVCGTADQIPLLPFPELFEAAFENWMQSKYSQASMILRQHIFEQHHLMQTLDMFHTVYFGQHGAAFENFAIALFKRMDGGRKGWNDRYALTELMRETYVGLGPAHIMERILIRPAKVQKTRKHLDVLRSILTEIALPWPIQNIIQKSSMAIHQQIYTFLIQIYRVRYLLQQSRHAQFRGKRNAQAFALLHKLIWLTDVLRSHLTETVIDFTVQDMMATMAKAEDIAEMARVHSESTASLKKKAMLSDELKPIYQAIMEILELGVSLHRTLHSDTTGSSKKQSSWKDKELLESDSDSHADEINISPAHRSRKIELISLHDVDRELQRLLPFVTSGLQSVGRAGGEPMWEQLSERLAWERTKNSSL